MVAFLDRLGGSRKRVALAIQDNPNQVLEFDACISEVHTGNASTTDHPVEQGANLTDHIQRTPEELQLTGIISDTPIVFLASVRAEPSIPGGDPRSRAQDAYGFIKNIKDSGLLCQVTTTLRDYANMAIVSFSVPRDKDRGRSVELSIGLREVLIATTEQVEAPSPVNNSRKKKTNQGKKQKTSTSSANQASSRSLLSRFTSLFGG